MVRVEDHVVVHHVHDGDEDGRHAVFRVPVEGGEPDRDIIESVLVDHSTGIRVLLAPPSPEGADLVTPAYLRKIVEGPIVWAPGVQGAVVASLLKKDIIENPDGYPDLEPGDRLAVGQERHRLGVVGPGGHHEDAVEDPEGVEAAEQQGHHDQRAGTDGRDPHEQAADRTDLIIVAPATADINVRSGRISATASATIPAGGRTFLVPVVLAVNRNNSAETVRSNGRLGWLGLSVLLLGPATILLLLFV